LWPFALALNWEGYGVDLVLRFIGFGPAIIPIAVFGAISPPITERRLIGIALRRRTFKQILLMTSRVLKPV